MNLIKEAIVGAATRVTVIKYNALISTSFKDAALSNCTFLPTISGASFEIYVAGKTSTTITWKIHIKRIVI